MSTTNPDPVEQQDAATVPLPANFPVSWDDPDDARLFWAHDRLHAPDPITPLDNEIFLFAYTYGMSKAAAELDLPVRAVNRRVNTYSYLAIAPVVVPPEEMEARGRRAQESLGNAMAQLGEMWSAEYLPEIKQHLAYWDAFDLAAASMAELLTHLDETVARAKRLWGIHSLVILPGYVAVSMFDDLYRDLFGSETGFDAFRLLQGFRMDTLETGRALWQLSRKALALPEVRWVLEEQAASEVIPTLERSAEGQAFLAELQAYLHEYGQRGDRWEISVPSWIEDPVPVIKNLKDYVSQPNRDLEAEMAMQATERERLLAEVRARLQNYPQPIVDQFELLLKAAQVGKVLGEDHGFWIDFRGMYRVRRVMLEFGRRFAAAGIIEHRDDIFYLTLDEIRAMAATPPRRDQFARVAGRRAEMKYYHTITPPPVLGTVPSGPPPDDPMSRFAGKFFGMPPQPASEPNSVSGNAGSPGIATGPARIIRSLADAARLQPGDILITETTAPPWTPLFATAAAVVTDTGGILSHCAVVAREYGIPAVVGTGMATTAIHDGQLLEVNGDTGIVRIIDEA